MSNGPTIELGGERFPFDQGKWGKLPALGAAIVLDLFHARVATGVQIQELHGWQAWWDQAPDPWGKLLQAKDVRKLDKVHREMAETGLGNRLGRRKMVEPPLPDRGLLARVAAIEWEEGLQFALGKLPLSQEPLRARKLLAGALEHVVALNKPHAQAWIVQWCHAHQVRLDADLSPGVLGAMWSTWARSRKFGADHPVYAQSLAVLPVEPGSEQELALWNQWVNEPFKQRTHEAIAAWCRLRAGSWERMHQKALQDEANPAWLLACRRAAEVGIKDALWKEAVSAPSTPAWMRTLWPKQRSALAAWMADSVICRQVDAEPGTDAVSRALVRLGAPLPGSEEDRKLLGQPLVDCMESYEFKAEWATAHPEWILPHPKSGRTALFGAENWYEARRYREMGLSWFHLDHAGQSAFGAFLVNFHPSGSDRKAFLAEMQELLARGGVPVVDAGRDGTIAGGLADKDDRQLFRAFLDVRLREPAPLLPAETFGVARHGSLDMLPSWKEACIARGEWDRAHEVAMWRGLLLGGNTREMPLPAVEDPQEPAWLWLLRRRDAAVSEVLEHLSCIPAWGLQAIDGAHPAWADPALSDRWLEIACGARKGGVDALVVHGAPAEWWVERMKAWESYGLMENMPPSKFFARLHEVGLPLDEPLVLDALLRLPLDDQAHLPEVFASALASRQIDLATPEVRPGGQRPRL